MSPRTAKQFEDIRRERKKEILEAALHLFAGEGYHTASVSKIARKAGVSKGLMYNYFTGKEDVLKTLVMDMFHEAMDQIDFKPGERLTREKFIHQIEVIIDLCLKNPQRWKLYMSLLFQPDVTPILMEEAMPAAAPYIAALTEYFSARGHKDPAAMVRLYSAISDGIQMQIILDPVNFPVELAKQYLIDQFA